MLNKEQQQAVETSDGKTLILAGAGTGKTLVLTSRIAYLLNKKAVPPEEILGLTFTNKAAKEMRERIAKMVSPESAKTLLLTTFHSFCLQILKKEIHHLGYTSNFTIAQEGDIDRLLGTIARELLQTKGEIPSLIEAKRAISDAKNRGLRPEELSEKSCWFDDFTKSLFERLNSAMRAHNIVDFDHLLYLTLLLLEDFPDIAAKYQERFRYILIDEYQDTNPIQYKLAALLSKKHGNLTVVGDDDQSIYGWRGADIANILGFDYDQAIKLEQNYRSTPNILKAANAVIKLNEKRHDKALWSSKDEGRRIELFHAPSDVEEAQAVVFRLLSLKEKLRLKFHDFAILYRSNALSRHFEQLLARTPYKEHTTWHRSIPYEVYGGQEFFQRSEVKDLFAYLRLIVNPHDQEALLRIINVPRRGIGDQSLDLITSYARKEKLPLFPLIESLDGQNHPIEADLSKSALHNLLSFVALIHGAKERFSKGSLEESLTWLIETIDYKRAIKEEVKSEAMRTFKWENIEELVSAIGEFEKSAEKPTLEEFVLSSPLGEADGLGKKKRGGDAVQLMTFHSAKGLEFPVVFLVGLEDHIIPHEKSAEERGIDEERRLMYVALTRAKERLHLSMAMKRNRMGKESPSRPSRFLFDIPKELLEITKWDAI